MQTLPMPETTIASDLPPFVDATGAQIAALRALLTECGYSERGICDRLGLTKLTEFPTLRAGRMTPATITDRLDVLIRLFLDGEGVERGAVAMHLRDGDMLLREIGLLQTHPAVPDRFAATALLYPIEGLYVVSDLDARAPGVNPPDAPMRADHVYSALTVNTRKFLDSLPSPAEGDFLELCSGTAVAALLAARAGARAWAVDITERATRFAEFNARLNGLPQLRALRGDLYTPVAGQTFDVIVAHPPYLATQEARYVFAHAGPDGEAVLRGMLAGLADHLRMGGRLYCTCASTDRAGMPLEQRIRQMLGERQAEFDIALVEYHGYHPVELYAKLAAGGRITFADAERQIALFRDLQAERMVYGSFVVRRNDRQGAPFTVRRGGNPKAGGPELEWLADWHAADARADAAERMLDAKVRLAAGATLHLEYGPNEGGWQARRAWLTVEHPFPRTTEVTADAATLLAECDGGRPMREWIAALRDAGTLAPGVADEAFVRFLAGLVAEGVLVTEGFEPPVHRT
jgi:SAM-dependent methyltransferase